MTRIDLQPAGTERARTGPTGVVLRWINTDRGRGFRAIRSRPFRFLYTGLVAQQLGFWTSHLTLQGLTEEVSGGDTFAISLLFAAMFAPAVVVGPIGGVLADRLDRRLVLMRTWSTMTAVALGLALVAMATDDPPLWSVYGLALMLGATFSLGNPALAAGIANSVDQRDLQSAILMQSAAANLTRVAGPLLAAPIIAAGLFHIGFFALAAACVFAVTVLARTRLRPFVPDADSVGVAARIVDGLRHARSRPPALRAISTVAVTSIFGVAHVALIPSFASDVLDQDAGVFTWLVAATGVGAVIGAMTVGYSRREATLSGAGFHQALYGVSMIAFAASSTLVVAAVAQVFVGFFYFTSMTRLQTLVQRTAAESKRARVMSLFALAWGGVVWIGALMLGAASDLAGLGVRTTLVAASAVLMAHGVVVAAKWRGREGATKERPDQQICA